MPADIGAAICLAAAEELGEELSIILSCITLPEWSRETDKAIERAALKCTIVAEVLSAYALNQHTERPGTRLNRLLDSLRSTSSAAS